MAPTKGGHDDEEFSHESSEPRPNPRVPDTSISSNFRQRRQQLQDQDSQSKHVKLRPSPPLPRSPASSIYLGSYSHGATSRSRTTLPGTSPVPKSPRMSISHDNERDIWRDLDPDLDSYGMEELREGFFDASFQKPREFDQDESLKETARLLAQARKKRHSLPKDFILRQFDSWRNGFRTVTTTRAGVKLIKSFLAFFISYIICLIPTTRQWLGRYSYIMVVSSILNHSGRPVGAQIDGAVLTIFGTATGLAWGSLALWVSTSTSVARSGYGGLLAASLVIFIAIVAAIRSIYIRLFQFALCAGISILYTCLADTSDSVSWGRLLDYAVPWLLGQAVSLIICCVIFPDAGARPLAMALHVSFKVMLDGFVVPNKDATKLHRQLANEFVALSVAYRDLALDISVTRFQPSDVETLRNLMQDVIRSLLALKVDRNLFKDFAVTENGFDDTPSGLGDSQVPRQTSNTSDDESSNPVEVVINIDPLSHPVCNGGMNGKAFDFVASKLSRPTAGLLRCSSDAIARCDAVLMDMSGYRKYLGPPVTVSSDVTGSLIDLHKAIQVYDEEELSLLCNPELPPTYSDHPEIVEIFLFMRPVRQAAGSVEKLLKKVIDLQQRAQSWRPYLPTYPWSKALHRTNATVRHDRGGVTAGFFFHSQNRLKKAMRGMSDTYNPPSRNSQHTPNKEKHHEISMSKTQSIGRYQEEEQSAEDPTSSTPTQQKLRYRIWKVLYRLQGFETKFALKAVLVTSLLAIPAWLPQSREWWNMHESWWAVVFAWTMLHPRVGGNIQDLLTRTFCAILGATWGGFAYAANNGNPYVMAVFAAVYMLPMIYRYTQSAHPRSGIAGCLSFVVVSLSAKAANGQPGIAELSWTRGLAFVIGIVTAVAVNFLLWPFVARHELRKALAAMLVYSSIIYRGVVAKYVYYGDGEEPSEADIAESEMLEGRLREGFVRMHQLLALTKHEVRLRGPFDPTPHLALITSLEQFFEYLVSVRQSSLFFHPHYLNTVDLNTTDPRHSAATSLLSYRRDAVAAILMNLYILAGALRGGRKVPRYLPSAAAARRRLLRKMDEVDAEQAEVAKRVAASSGDISKAETMNSQKKWSQIYAYSYNQSLTGCVRELELLQMYTKQICGEQGFDPMNYVPPVDDEEEAIQENEQDDSSTSGRWNGNAEQGRPER